MKYDVLPIFAQHHNILADYGHKSLVINDDMHLLPKAVVIDFCESMQ